MTWCGGLVKSVVVVEKAVFECDGVEVAGTATGFAVKTAVVDEENNLTGTAFVGGAMTNGAGDGDFIGTNTTTRLEAQSFGQADPSLGSQLSGELMCRVGVVVRPDGHSAPPEASMA